MSKVSKTNEVPKRNLGCKMVCRMMESVAAIKILSPFSPGQIKSL
jgi:hypothetical protein